VCTDKAKSRYLRREKWSRPGAVGIVGHSTCMPHVAPDANKACWLLACSEGLLDIPGERACLGGGPVVVCVRKKRKVDFCLQILYSYEYMYDVTSPFCTVRFGSVHLV
jgi:hypothetical protein